MDEVKESFRKKDLEYIKYRRSLYNAKYYKKKRAKLMEEENIEFGNV